MSEGGRNGQSTIEEAFRLTADGSDLSAKLAETNVQMRKLEETFSGSLYGAADQHYQQQQQGMHASSSQGITNVTLPFAIIPLG